MGGVGLPDSHFKDKQVLRICTINVIFTLPFAFLMLPHLFVEKV